MEITALKSKIQDSKAPQETWARKMEYTTVTGNYTAGPFWSARIVAAAIVSSNGTTFVKAPGYKKALRDEKQKSRPFIETLDDRRETPP